LHSCMKICSVGGWYLVVFGPGTGRRVPKCYCGCCRSSCSWNQFFRSL